MSEKENNGYSKYCLLKTIDNDRIYLYKSWSLFYGTGYYCHTLNLTTFKIGFGFGKNKFTAVKQALKYE